MGQTELLQIAPPMLQSLAARAGNTVNLAVPDGNFMAYVAQEEGPQAVRATARLGTRRPLNCSGLGKAYLATLPPDELAERLATMPFIRLTERSIMDPATLARQLDGVRERGYAVDDLEVEDGVGCVAAAVRDFRGRTVAAISVAGPVERIRASTELIAAELLQTTSQLSTRLGYLP
jgi:DNA-binding IclR family transcriptional regulator